MNCCQISGLNECCLFSFQTVMDVPGGPQPGDIDPTVKIKETRFTP